MESICRRLQSTWASYKRREDEKRACVALILRQGRNFDGETQLAEVLEVAFILRSINPNDRWSGHVALPGGRQEHGESDKQTAVRETFEEVGWDLSDDTTFQAIGRLDDRPSVRGLSVSCIVFRQLSEITPVARPNPSEVAAVGWCPLAALMGGPETVAPLKRDMLIAIPPEDTFARRASEVFGPRQIYFPSLLLPIRDLTSPCSSIDPQQDFVLWGMTLGVLTDLLLLTALRDSRVEYRAELFGLGSTEIVCESRCQSVAIIALRHLFNDKLGCSLYTSEVARRFVLLQASAATTLVAAMLASVVRRQLRFHGQSSRL